MFEICWFHRRYDVIVTTKYTLQSQPLPVLYHEGCIHGSVAPVCGTHAGPGICLYWIPWATCSRSFQLRAESLCHVICKQTNCRGQIIWQIINVEQEKTWAQNRPLKDTRLQLSNVWKLAFNDNLLRSVSLESLYPILCFVPYTVEVQLLYQALVAHLIKSFRKVNDQDIRLPLVSPYILHAGSWTNYNNCLSQDVFSPKPYWRWYRILLLFACFIILLTRICSMILQAIHVSGIGL